MSSSCHSAVLLRRCAYHPRNNSRRTNFVKTAGFAPNTSSTEFANKKLLLLGDGRHLTYNDVNIASGRYAAMLNRQFGVQVLLVWVFFGWYLWDLDFLCILGLGLCDKIFVPFIIFGYFCLQKGDTVLCRSSKSPEALALYLGVLRLGATYVPLNPTYTKRETEHFVNVMKWHNGINK
jgi:acyl-CoA synthetase (AMP-forming)/AMP-acid ligase II